MFPYLFAIQADAAVRIFTITESDDKLTQLIFTAILGIW